MCLAIPVRITDIEGQWAKAKLQGLETQVNISFLDNVKIGEFVLVHAGFAIQRVDEEKAKETLSLLEKLR